MTARPGSPHGAERLALRPRPGARPRGPVVPRFLLSRHRLNTGVTLTERGPR
ncbi:MAG: hypothetical protein QOJ73_1176 [Streptosporangiaceae bacterium]|jgi:hypothetical protein|nr:hypothetical protein [Streptosporangiaceae bacterium]